MSIKMEAGIDFIGIGCGAIVINSKNEALLVKRVSSARTEPGYYSRPGGEVEFGETIEEAVEREVFEETGVKVKALRLLEITQNIDKEKGRHWIAVGYLAEYISGTAENKECDKHEEVGWFPLSALPEPLNNYTRNAIKKYFELKK